MDYFNFKDSDLYAEDIKATDLAEKYGTPLYVYSKATLYRHMNSFENSLKEKKHFSARYEFLNNNILKIK